jgi:hypothetical protein
MSTFQQARRHAFVQAGVLTRSGDCNSTHWIEEILLLPARSVNAASRGFLQAARVRA